MNTTKYYYKGTNDHKETERSQYAELLKIYAELLKKNNHKRAQRDTK